MFDKIKETLNKSNGSGGYKDILRLTVGNTYLVRLLPNIKNVDDTFHHYFSFGWESKATGQYVSAVSPITHGERCPLNELRVKLYRSNNASDKELAGKIRRNEQWMVNCLVIENPTAPDSVGQVKILRYGKQLDKIIKDAISGDDAEDYGAAIFDLSPKGCNLRIKVEKNEGGFPTYVASRFLKASAIPSMTDAKMEEVYNSVHDLSSIEQIKTYAELEEMIATHILCKPTASNVDEELEEKVSVKTIKTSKPSPLDEELPMDDAPAAKPAKKRKVEEIPDSFDDELSELVAGL